MLGKKSEEAGLPPIATDLYIAILKDNGKSILMSDEYLTDSSFKVWYKLLKLGHKISVFDIKTSDILEIGSPEQLKQYYRPNGNRFRFIISENALKECAINANFRIYKLRRDNNML